MKQIRAQCLLLSFKESSQITALSQNEPKCYYRQSKGAQSLFLTVKESPDATVISQKESKGYCCQSKRAQSLLLSVKEGPKAAAAKVYYGQPKRAQSLLLSMKKAQRLLPATKESFLCKQHEHVFMFTGVSHKEPSAYCFRQRGPKVHCC